jgi:hypothetical protein
LAQHVPCSWIFFGGTAEGFGVIAHVYPGTIAIRKSVRFAFDFRKFISPTDKLP